MYQDLCKVATFRFVLIDNLLYFLGDKLKALTNGLNLLHGSTLLLFSNFCGKSDQIEYLMKEALSCSNTNLSPNLDVDWIVYFPC